MTVNCCPCAQVNRPVSAHGLTVLRALSATATRTLPTAAVRSAIYARDGAAARAGLSRTLRRLWSAGYVELYHTPWTCDASSLTYRRYEQQAELAEIEQNPEDHYQAYLTNRPKGWPDAYGSATKYLHMRRLFARMPSRGYYVRFVEITDAGLERLTVNPAPQLTAEDSDRSVGVLQPDTMSESTTL